MPNSSEIQVSERPFLEGGGLVVVTLTSKVVQISRDLSTWKYPSRFHKAACCADVLLLILRP